MNVATIIRLILATLIPGSLGIGAAIYFFDDVTGYFSLLTGYVLGIIGTQFYYVPRLIEKWESTGIPGEPKSPEQREIWEQEKKREQWNRNLSIIVGVLSVALLKQLLPNEILLLLIPAIFGGLAGYVFRYALLIYQKRGKLGA